MKSKKLSEKILRSIKSRGFRNIALDPVLETKYILQRSGENFKKFLFSFYDLNGKELCLRPDLTISSVIRFIQNKKDNREKVFYSGEAFRKNYQKKDSIIKNQIGYEILGSKNKQKDDKEIIDTSLKILKNSGFKKSVLISLAEETSKKLIKHINYLDKYIISIDVPSGLSSIYEQKNNNTNTIIANETLCISGIKDCCLTLKGHKYSNKLINLDIGITKYPKNYKYKFLINPQASFNLIPKKDPYGDKRLSGETLIVGGSKKYPGSMLMAASATLNTGVGLLSLAIPLSIYDVIAGKIPEATLDTINNNNEFISKDNIKYLFENKKRINSLLIGCGMESNNTTQASVDFLLKNISNHFKYLNGIVIDADGLNNLSKINEWWKYKLPKNTIITPHVREMSRLTGLSISKINKNPIEILETYTKLWNVTIVLKGPLTFIGNPHKKYILNRPNPGLAKGGTGDVLAGMINSFLAQGLNSEHSTILAVSLISESGEISKEKYGIHGSTASKLINNISKIINQNN